MNTGYFLDIVSGITHRVQAILHSAGSGDADKIVRLDSTGRFSQTTMPVGVTPDTQEIAAFETLTANDLVHVFDGGGGIPSVRKADATAVNKFHCTGFVKDNFTTGQTALVYYEGRITGMVGLTPGDFMFLSTIPGQSSAVPVSGDEDLSQRIGIATDATSISFERAEGIVLSPAEI